MESPPSDLFDSLLPEGEDRDALKLALVRAFSKGLAHATVEALLDALREEHHEDVGRMSDELGCEDERWYYRARRSGTLPTNLLTLILVKYGDRVRFDPVYGEKRGYLEAVNLAARRLGMRGEGLTMAQLDAIMRILSSANPIAEIHEEQGLRAWIRPFLIAMMFLTSDRDGPGGYPP